MQNESLLDTAWKILRNSKLVWVFTFVNYLLLVFISSGNLVSSPIAILLCCIYPFALVFLIVTPLAITITMYHGYLGEAIKFKEVLADLKKYALRWIGIFLLYIPSLVIIILTYRIINTMNFMLYIFIFNLLGGLFGSFFFGYIKLEIIRNDSGIWDALKHGARVWIKRPLVKTMIVLVFSFLQLIVSLLIVTTQKGISMIIFSMRYQEYATLLKPLMPRLLINIFDAVCTPLFLAFIMSAYFGELQMMEPNETRPNLI